MTPAEALQRAVAILSEPFNLHAETAANASGRARAWVAIAAELRAQASATPRPAVQDVEVRYCHHGVTVVRLPGGASEAWWHPGSRGWCDDPQPVDIPAQPAARPMRVTTREDRQRIALVPTATPGGRTARVDPETGTASAIGPRTCVSCGQMVERDGQLWRHSATRQYACVPAVGGKAGTAWPVTQ